MSAGRRSPRTTVTSRTTAITMPTPISFIATSSPNAKPTKTTQIAAAASVTTGPVRVMPWRTASAFAVRGSAERPRARQPSVMRDNRNTS